MKERTNKRSDAVDHEETKSKLKHYLKTSKNDIMERKFHIIKSFNQDLVKHKLFYFMKFPIRMFIYILILP